jgi:hypothetical protein
VPLQQSALQGLELPPDASPTSCYPAATSPSTAAIPW